MSDAVQETVVQVEEVPAETNNALVQVAKEVIAGRWGRGNVRKERLKEAGFDPEAVQKEVEKIFNR